MVHIYLQNKKKITINKRGSPACYYCYARISDSNIPGPDCLVCFLLDAHTIKVTPGWQPTFIIMY